MATRRDGTGASGRGRRRLAGLLLLCALAPAAQAAQTVQALRYGTSLYHFYQQDYFGALTELMAAQTLDALGPHSAGAELLRGGMALSWGMDREARAVFTQQLSRPGADVDADRAWFYLGKMAWQRGDSALALETLARMAPDYQGEVADEALYLRASARLQQGDTAAASADRERLPRDSYWRRHLDYNLGAADAARGDWTAALPHFDSIAAAPARHAEGLALRDKSLTAAGYAALAAGQYQRADAAFSRVRLDGPFAARAMLGYGWSAAESGDYLRALTPWQALSQRALFDDSARESLLAVPYALDRLGRPGAALQHYQAADQRYASELQHLERAAQAFRSAPLEPLLGIASAGDSDWFISADILPDTEYAALLQHLVSRADFQVALRELRDLHALSTHLARARERLTVMLEVDRQQQQAWATLVEQDGRAQLAARQQALGRQTRALRAKLQRAIAQGDGRLLADTAQSARWQRLQRAQQAVARLAPGDAQAAHYQRRLRLLRGQLIWEDSEQYAARAWRARRALRELEALTAQSDAALARLDAAIASRARSSFAARIHALAARTQVQSRQVQATLAAARVQLRQVAVAELERQGELLRRARGQGQLAIAHLHDRAQGDTPRD